MSTELCALSNHRHIAGLKQQLFNEARLRRCADFKADYSILEEGSQPDADILMAQARYHCIEKILPQALTGAPRTHKIARWMSKVDHFFLHRIFGLPIFLAVMYSLFVFAINVGGAFQDFFDISSNAIFVEGMSHFLNSLQAPSYLVALLASGLGKGINTVVTFIPVMGAMFLALTVLEESGYMARASFVVDRVMQAVGLPGKSFVPLIVGFGCNVPAVMGARTLEKKRDRILTVVMSPFMSCGARLAIFTLFVSAFFPEGGQNVVFLLYLIGIVMAILTGLLLKKTVLSGAPSSMVLELPLFRIPKMRHCVPQAMRRLTRFIKNAATVIIPLCLIIGTLNSISLKGELLLNTEAHQDSVLASIGKGITPLFKPMGIERDNWPATVGLFSGLLAKEVVVGTLNALYTQNSIVIQNKEFDLVGDLKEAVYSIPNNVLALGPAFINPLADSMEVDLSESDQARVYGAMLKHFDGRVGAFAYLLFVLLYFPCVSVTAAMLKEVERKWTLFSIVWTTGLAYGVAVMFYQVATFKEHPTYSLFWITLMSSALFLVVIAMNHMKLKVSRALPTRIVVS
jgi:ferrous iron transport protein B